MRLFVALLLLLCAGQAWAGERILALSPHICEMLYAIGAGDEVVGGVDYCDMPAEARALPRVGSYDRISSEAALALRPTMAVALDEQMAGVATLKRFGVRIVRSNPATVDEVLDDLRRLGELTGHRQQADRVAADFDRRLRKLAARRPDHSLEVLYELWPDPLLVVGGRGFLQDVLQRLGLHNVFSDIPMESPKVNLESVIRARPQIIIVPEEGRDVTARQRFWRQWLGDGVRVVAVNPDLLQRPGPRLIDGMEALMRKLRAGGADTDE